MAVPQDDPSRYLLGLAGRGDGITVRRADMVSIARAREAHAQAVIAAWTAARAPVKPRVSPSWTARLRRRARAAWRQLR